jgi:transmembrane sensor
LADPIVPEQRHADLIDQAAEWLAALDSGSARVSAFEAWRAADPRHAVAFAEVAGSWRDLDALRVSQSDLPPPPHPDMAKGEPRPRRHFLKAAAGAVAVAAMGGGFAFRAYARGKAETAVGERKTVPVAKGVAVDLNTDSCIYWRDATPAALWLERGEVAIRLDAGRALDLRTPGGQFRLAPGAYNARLRGAACELAVVAGSIADARGVRATAGEVALATQGMLERRAEAADLARITAWQNDTLVLNGESLDYALAEINRYQPHKIMIGDPALARLRLGGTFTTRDPAEFLSALRSAFGVRATIGTDGGIVLTRG